MLRICRYLLRKNIWRHSRQILYRIRITLQSWCSGFRPYAITNCHIFYIPWLLQTNHTDTTWLASRLPLFSRDCPDRSQLSQALLFIRSGWLLLLSCCVECSSPSIIQWILCFQKQIRFVINNRSCCLYYSRLFRNFITAISYVLAPMSLYTANELRSSWRVDWPHWLPTSTICTYYFVNCVAVGGKL